MKFDASTNHLLLIDSSGFAYRAHFAYAPTRTKDGMATHAITGFMQLVWQMLGRVNASHVAAVFDAPGWTFRHALYPKYKSNRERPKDLDDQLPLMRQAADAMGICPIEHEGFEADDVIASLVHRALAHGWRATIVSGDKDFGQLAQKGKVEIYNPVSRAIVSQEEIEQKWGVAAHLVPDVQALAGDPVDGIPGVPGVGMKKAAGLIRRYGTLSALLKDLDKPRGFMSTPALRVSMRRSRKNIPIYHRLALLRTDVPLSFSWDDFKPQGVQRAHLIEILRALDAEDMINTLFGNRQSRDVVRTAPHDPSPLEWWSEELREPGQPIPDFPQSGYYKRKLTHGGPYVGARIWREREIDYLSRKATHNDVILCEVNGTRRDAKDEWMRLVSQPITEIEFLHNQATGKWAREHAPKDPMADPTKRTDWNTVPAPSFKREKRS